MSFGVGDQVVCVDDSIRTGRHLERPVRGRVYTIRAIGRDCADDLGVLVHEIVNKPNPKCPLGEHGFLAHRFRPVRKTDISVFTALLKTKPIKEVA